MSIAAGSKTVDDCTLEDHPLSVDPRKYHNRYPGAYPRRNLAMIVMALLGLWIRGLHIIRIGSCYTAHALVLYWYLAYR